MRVTSAVFQDFRTAAPYTWALYRYNTQPAVFPVAAKCIEMFIATRL